MGGHAHDGIMDGFSISDIIVITVFLVLLFLTGIYLLRQLRRQCIRYIQNEIQREVEAAAAAQQAVKFI